MVKKDLEKILSKVYENYTMNKDVHEMAYTLNSEYKNFWDNHSEELKKKLLKGQKIMRISQSSDKVQEGLFHFATLGVSYGIKKLFQKGKPSREEQIKNAVTSEDFTELLKALNDVMWSKNK